MPDVRRLARFVASSRCLLDAAATHRLPKSSSKTEQDTTRWQENGLVRADISLVVTCTFAIADANSITSPYSKVRHSRQGHQDRCIDK